MVGLEFLREYLDRSARCQPGLRKQVDGLLDELFGRACVVCALDSRHGALCEACAAALPRLGRTCRTCAVPLADASGTRCGACQRSPPPFDSVRAPLAYAHPVDRLVQRFKFQRDIACGRALGAILVGHLLSRDAAQWPDLWAPVPMHRWRLCRRLVNPAHELAVHLARASGRPLARHRLQRCRRTPTQTGLSATERRRNLRGAFRWRGPPPRDLHVGLVDDVLTTGSTASECARVLRRAGAASVSAWVAARALSP